jgi:hypothetical protein
MSHPSVRAPASRSPRRAARRRERSGPVIEGRGGPTGRAEVSPLRALDVAQAECCTAVIAVRGAYEGAFG